MASLSSRLLRDYILVITSIFLTFGFYAWLTDLGFRINDSAAAHYYGQLADAFLNGHLYLEMQPDPALTALQNPYDPQQRLGLTSPLDVSLYAGKFYLYFGPIPALILIILRLWLGREIGEYSLVLAFTASIFIMKSLFIMRLWRLFFHDLPAWLVPFSLLSVGLINPYGWILLAPTVYNAAITSGQFFLLAGFFSAATALEKSPPSIWLLTLTGILWVFSFGSRMTLFIPIAFMTYMIILWIIKVHHQPSTSSGGLLLALGLPVMAGLSLLGWYNWARFGSIFETGFLFALTRQPLQKYSNVLFSPVYVLQNLYNYILIPPQLRGGFPFLSVLRGRREPIFSIFGLPAIYYTQEIAGILISTPFVLFAILPILNWFKARTARAVLTFGAAHDATYYRWIITTLFGSFLLAFGVLLSFFWVSTRYTVDFMPFLELLSVLGFWQGYRLCARRPFRRTLFACLGIALAASSVVVGNLLTLSLYSGQIRELDPALWRQIIQFFSR